MNYLLLSPYHWTIEATSMNIRGKLNFKDYEIYEDNTKTIRLHIESSLAYDLGMLLEEDVKEEMHELHDDISDILDD